MNKAEAMLQEMAEQRSVLGNRAAQHAGTICELLEEIARLKKQLEEMTNASGTQKQG